MIRQIIHIDEEKCNGCGLCAKACHESAIAIIDGKAKLIRDDYCDGMGDCLPNCPSGAISFVNREASAYDEVAVEENKRRKQQEVLTMTSRLNNWPVQIKLAPIQAPCFMKAKLLIAADCTAYAYAAFHETFLKGKTVLVGCPKLDGVNYSDKLTDIIKNNDVVDVTIVRMEVPCCGGLELAAKKAIQNSGKGLPWKVVTIGINGEIMD